MTPHRRLIALFALALLLPALAHGTSRPASEPAPVWPAPPAAARVRWVASVSSDRAPDARRSLLSRVRDAVTGERARVLKRPVAVCAADDGSVLVSDPAASTVYEQRAGERALRVFATRRLATPVGVAKLPAGDVWVADADRGVLVHFSAKGEWKGEAGGGELLRPTGLACDAARGRLYVADAQAHAIAVYDVAGKRLMRFGERGDKPGQFNFPTDVKVLPNGELLVCDALNFRVQRLSPEGAPLAAFGQGGDKPGTFARPKGVAVDPDGHIYVVDALHDAVQVFDATGRLLLVVGGRGEKPGRFNLPAGIAIGRTGEIFVADMANARVQQLQYVPEGGSR